MFRSVTDVRGRRSCGSFSKRSLPSLKHLHHTNTRIRERHSSPYCCWSLWWILADGTFSATRNLFTMRCSTLRGTFCSLITLATPRQDRTGSNPSRREGGGCGFTLLRSHSCCPVRLVYTQIRPGHIWTTLYIHTYTKPLYRADKNKKKTILGFKLVSILSSSGYDVTVHEGLTTTTFYEHRVKEKDSTFDSFLPLLNRLCSKFHHPRNLQVSLVSLHVLYIVQFCLLGYDTKDRLPFSLVSLMSKRCKCYTPIHTRSCMDSTWGRPDGPTRIVSTTAAERYKYHSRRTLTLQTYCYYSDEAELQHSNA